MQIILHTFLFFFLLFFYFQICASSHFLRNGRDIDTFSFFKTEHWIGNQGDAGKELTLKTIIEDEVDEDEQAFEVYWT